MFWHIPPGGVIIKHKIVSDNPCTKCVICVVILECDKLSIAELNKKYVVFWIVNHQLSATTLLTIIL